jgi:hypothetical protein
MWPGCGEFFHQFRKGKAAGPGCLLPEIGEGDKYTTEISRQCFDLEPPKAGVVRPAMYKHQRRAGRIALY